MEETVIFNAMASQEASYRMVVSQKVTTITSAMYSLNNFQYFSKVILAATKKVPTEQRGSNHGHTWLVTSKADYKTFCGKDIMQDVVPNPKADPEILGNDSHATIILKTVMKAIALNKYYTHQGSSLASVI